MTDTIQPVNEMAAERSDVIELFDWHTRPLPQEPRWRPVSLMNGLEPLPVRVTAC